jgi:tetratricopeptide (TPR) repeat protein
MLKNITTESYRAGFNKRFGLVAGCLLLTMGILAGCKPKSSATPDDGPANAAGYFQTPFQSECEFIVQAIVSDLAEQMYYAANHRLPDKKSFSITATEKSGTPVDEPVYALQIRLDAKHPELKFDITINGPIWSPQVYQDVAKQLAQAVALSPGSPKGSADTALLEKLKDGKPETIEQENQHLSAALENDFSNPELHEQAALLLGAFMLRDHSGKFFEIRSPLSRLTAHLTMARFLRGSMPAGSNGQMAETMMLTLVNDEAQAMKLLNDIGTNNSAALPMVRALQTRNTGDYRPMDKMDDLSGVEAVEWFYAWANYVATVQVWPKLSEAQKQTVDFVRIANESGNSVEIGHELLAASIPLEMQEIQSVYTLSHPEKLTEKTLVPALNEPPDGCFNRTGGAVHVHVIGWGQWADFLQRHLCHAVQQNFNFMNYRWGVPDDAKEFAAKCEQSFDGLRLYPFVRRFNCTDVEGYHKAVDDGFKVTVATPQLVPAECWNYLCYKVNFAPWYNPNPNPHINEWHNHNPPPGTVYDLHPRLNHPSLVNQPKVGARFEHLHEMAPYDFRIIDYLLKRKYTDKLNYEQATNLFQAVLPYSVYAMRTAAKTVYDQPEQYTKLMLQAAALDPVSYYTLGDYEIDRQEEDQAAKYIDQACAADPDSVRVSNHAYWRVKYYLKKGQIKKARRIADEGGEIYSGVGLEAKAFFLEGTTNYTDAFEWYARIQERYNDSKPLILFCERYKTLTGDTRFEPELKKWMKKVFPNGTENVSLADLQGAPTDGVLIQQQNKLVTAAGLRSGDVIVALNGTRTHTLVQYLYVRESLTGPEMDLIVWQGSSYHEIKANPPNHLFGVNFNDYQAQ